MRPCQVMLFLDGEIVVGDGALMEASFKASKTHFLKASWGLEQCLHGGLRITETIGIRPLFDHTDIVIWFAHRWLCRLQRWLCRLCWSAERRGFKRWAFEQIWGKKHVLAFCDFSGAYEALRIRGERQQTKSAKRPENADFREEGPDTP